MQQQLYQTNVHDVDDLKQVSSMFGTWFGAKHNQ